MNFEVLPPELLLQTLQQVESAKELHNLISASPACLRVFLKFSGTIFSSLIKSSLHPVVLPEIAAIADAPEYIDDSPEAFRDELPAFFNNYFGPRNFTFPTNRDELMRMYRITWRVNRFVHGYFKHSMYQIGNTDLNEPSASSPNGEGSSGANTPSPDASLSPSDNEVARLQRAFLRYELYCRVFPASDLVHGGSVTPGRGQFRLFLSRLPPWEVEEISCAHQYLVTVLGYSLDDLEDQFIDAVMAAQSSSCESEERREFKLRRLAPGGGSARAHGHLFSGQSIFTQFQRTDAYTYLSYMASLGINSVHAVTHAKGQRLGKLIRENYPATRDFLPEALMHAPPSAERTVQPDNFDNSNLALGNFGYYMFKSINMNTYLTIIYAGMVNLPLRDMGYVFWDSDRFQDFGVYRLFMRAKTPHRQDIFTRFMRRSRPSVGEKLQGVMLPPGEMERIERQFASLRDLAVHAADGNGDESD